MYLATVIVTLKPLVNDPQGLAIKGGLQSLGFGGVQNVRAGKYIEITLDAADQSDAENQVGAMCAKLLANPVIETYRFEVRETE
jgi:phosphoribosylformylglycinamidine synthase subunit PurS